MKSWMLLIGLAGALALAGCERKPKQEPVEQPTVSGDDTQPLGADEDTINVVDLSAIELNQKIGRSQQFPGGLEAVSVTVNAKPKKCRSRCATYQASWMFFTNAPALNNTILGLLSARDGGAEVVVRINTANELAQLLTKQATLFIRDAAEYQQAWSADLSLEVLPGAAGINVLRLDESSYTGGAHGNSSSQYLNWDAENQQLLTLDNIIQAGQSDAFWSEVEQVYEDWLRGLDDPASVMESWPFERTDNVALLPKFVRLQYQSYQLGPYSEGMPSFDVPYARLKSIIQPQLIGD